MRKTMAYPSIMIIGGDNTSDRFGAALAQKIMEKCPNATLFGVGGPMMSDAGVRLLYDISEMVSLGVFESIKGTQVVKRLIKRVIETMDEERPDVVLQIGLPVFGFRLLEIAQCKSLPVVYYYTPLSRGLENVKVGRFAGVVDKVASISLFETTACQEAGIDVEFVGHPLMDLVEPAESKEAAREILELSQSSSVISILPGAREVEVKNVLPTVLKSLCQVQKTEPDIEIVISVAPTIRESSVEKIIDSCHCDNVKLRKDTYSVLGASDLAVTSIGTASLEASLMGVPSIAVYRVPATTYFIDKLLDRKPYMTITNNILRETVIPEYIQSDFGHARIADEVRRLLKDEEARQAMLTQFKRLPHELGEAGSVERAADLILEMAGCEQ
ncbi:MAG: lipid-A-disaccharide synthase [Firmicutes bacterium]|nr:lipid-A-disaccharide synthase [Bacillota bacterium]